MKNESVVIYGFGILFMILMGFYFLTTGYPNIITETGDLGVPVPSIYMLPIFLPYGILLGELFYMHDEGERVWSMVIKIVLITIFAIIRMTHQLPISGHAVIISFFLLHQIFTNRKRYPVRIVIGVVILLETMIYKIILWDDFMTFSLGLMFGSLIWVVGLVLQNQQVKKSM